MTCMTNSAQARNGCSRRKKQAEAGVLGHVAWCGGAHAGLTHSESQLDHHHIATHSMAQHRHGGTGKDDSEMPSSPYWLLRAKHKQRAISINHAQVKSGSAGAW